MKKSLQILVLLTALFSFPSTLSAQSSATETADSSQEDSSRLTKQKRLNDRVWIVKSATNTNGHKIKQGQKIRLGKGSATGGTFNFVRLYTGRSYNAYSESTDKKSLNSISPAGPELAGAELVVHKIVLAEGRKKAPAQYWLINKPSGGMFQIEIEMEAAIKSGELLPPQ